MPPAARFAARVFFENHGKWRDAGTERTSARVVALAACSIARKRSAEMLEWPMLRRSNEDMRHLLRRAWRFHGRAFDPDRVWSKGAPARRRVHKMEIPKRRSAALPLSARRGQLHHGARQGSIGLRQSLH